MSTSVGTEALHLYHAQGVRAVPVRESGQDAFQMGKCSQKDMDMEDLVRGEEVVKGTGCEPLRYSIGTFVESGN